MGKKIIIIAVVFMVASFFVSTTIYAGTDVKDVIKLNDKAYAKHTKGIVTFSHKKHQKEYEEKHPEFYKKACGECHHDKDGKPLSKLKEGDKVQKCIECHKKPKYIKGKKAKGLSKKQKREYHANALHDNCKGCHKKYNKKMKLKSKNKKIIHNRCKTSPKSD